MRTMLDALYPLDIPLSADPQIIAAYKHHPENEASYDQAVARFPNAIHVSITPDPAFHDCQILDVEATDATPADVPLWTVLTRQGGIEPTVYCNQHNGWDEIKAAVAAAGLIAPPCYWVADYDGVIELPAGSSGKQYANAPMTGLNADASCVADYWPTIDTGDNVPALTEEQWQFLQNMNAKLDASHINAAGELWAFLNVVNEKLDANGINVAGELLTKVEAAPPAP